MRTSDTIGKLAAALVAAQADLRGVEKSATNPHFKSKYAPLDAIIGMVRPALRQHGLAVVQSAQQSGDDKGLEVETRLIHESGEWMANEVYIPLATFDPQGAGAAVTYGRRFGLSALLSISTDEDDDGNHASTPTKTPRAEPQRRQERPAAVEAMVTAGPVAEKPPEEMVWEGKALGLYTSRELAELITKTLDKPKMAKLREACHAVLDRRTGPKYVDEAVARMKAEVEDETKPLDALFDAPKSPNAQLK